MVPKLAEFKGIMQSSNDWDLVVDSKKDSIMI